MKLTEAQRDYDLSPPFSQGCLFGGLPRTATSASETCIDATTVHANRHAPATLSSDPATKSFCARQTVTPPSLGEDQFSDATGRPELNARSFETRGQSFRRSLSDRLTPLLISSGLVAGITPSLTRKQSNQPIQVLALSMPVGVDAAKANSGFSYSSGEPAGRAILRAEGETP